LKPEKKERPWRRKRQHYLNRTAVKLGGGSTLAQHRSIEQSDKLQAMAGGGKGLRACPPFKK